MNPATTAALDQLQAAASHFRVVADKKLGELDEADRLWAEVDRLEAIYDAKPLRMRLLRKLLHEIRVAERRAKLYDQEIGLWDWKEKP
jgi:hypothetical protein